MAPGRWALTCTPTRRAGRTGRSSVQPALAQALGWLGTDGGPGVAAVPLRVGAAPRGGRLRGPKEVGGGAHGPRGGGAPAGPRAPRPGPRGGAQPAGRPGGGAGDGLRPGGTPAGPAPPPTC